MTSPTGKYAFVPRFLKLSGMNILANLMVPLAGLIDMAFLGHLADIRHLAGVAIATILFNYIYWTFGFLRMGTTGMTAQALGRNNQSEVLLVGLRNSLLAIVLGVLILILQYPLRELGFALLSATASVKASGIMFYNALIWGAPATLLNFVLLGWFLGRSQGQQVVLLSLVGSMANIGLDYLFIVKLGWESAGAGAATALSQYATAGVGLILIAIEYGSRFPTTKSQAKSRVTPNINLRKLLTQLWEPKALQAAFSLNRDILIRTLIMVSAFSAFTNLGSGMGTIVLATNTLLLQIVTLSAYLIDGIAFATESFAGIFYGQAVTQEINPKESKPAHQLLPLIWVAGGLSLGLGLAIALLVALFPLPIFSLLTIHLEVVQQIPDYVFWLLPVLGFGSIAFMLDGYFIGLTAGNILLRSAIVSSLVGFAPVATLAWYWQNPHLLWLALALFMVGRVIPMAIAVPKTLSG
jgi:multidrug resistance protein, MATE family